eukprot:TRINITY_DN4200_c0_g1_i1.p1 TRINITY_DN4200_c0_g1~~TRINITY_DN4200_c0_g1_i1.p1  ORF type:complete len:602 (+),score=87.46 TRINITY_DN4200_c0_g1_i1:53-1858(+)
MPEDEGGEKEKGKRKMSRPLPLSPRNEEAETKLFSARRGLETCFTPPPAPMASLDTLGEVTVGSGLMVMDIPCGSEMTSNDERHFEISKDSCDLGVPLRPRAQTCLVRKPKKRSSRCGFDSSRFYHHQPMDDPLSPPLGLMGSPGSTQRKRSNVLFSRETCILNGAPKGAGVSVVVIDSRDGSSTPPQNVSHSASLASGNDLGQQLQRPPQRHLSSTFGSMIPSDFASEEARGITSPTYCDSDESSFSGDDSSIQARVPKTGFPLAQDDNPDPMTVIQECVEDEAAVLDLFELELAALPIEVFTTCVHITSLDISNNDISDLGDGIGALVNLKSFMAKSNSLTRLPDEIENCRELTELLLDQNQLREVPHGMRKLKKLQKVGLDWNEVVGFPTPLCELENLETLYIVENPDLALPTDPNIWKCKKLVVYLDNSPSLLEQRDSLLETNKNISVQLNQIFPDKIIPDLYLGSLRSAQEVRIYSALNITYLASIGRELSVVTSPDMVHMQCNVDDLVDTDLGKIFEQVHNFIDEALKKKAGCLVHCFKGQSRSATMVISYLMKMKKLKRDAAIELVKSRRPMINPNKGFMELLLRYEKSLGLDE